MLAKDSRTISLILIMFFVGLHNHVVFSQDTRQHVVFIAGEEEYGAHWTLPKVADDLERRFNIKTSVIHSWRSGAHDYDMPGEVEIPEFEEIENLEMIKDADLVVMHIRFRLPPPEQLQIFQDYFDSGKPAIAFRTTSHGMWAADQKNWFVPFFGGHYKGHMPNTQGTTTIVPGEQLDHPILRGVPKRHSYNDIMGVYITAPLNDSATPLMMGKTGYIGPSQPVTWINEYKPGQKIFYASFGGLESFVDPGFLNMVYNAIYWALDKEVPENGVLGINDLSEWEEEAPFEKYGFGALMENPFELPEEDLELENRLVLDGEFQSSRVPAPPKAAIPKKATVLFDGTDLSRWRHWDLSADPVAMLPDARAVSPSPDFPEARWKVVDGAVEARPGYGSILTREEFGNYRIHLDFLIPDEPDYVPEKYKGSGSIFLDGRYEIKILDSYGKESSKVSNGSIFKRVAPSSNPSKPVNSWQSLDIEYRQFEGQRPTITVDLNGERIHDQVTALSTAPFAIREEGNFFISNQKDGAGVYNLGKDNWSAEVRFRTFGEGYLLSNAPLDGPWDENSKGVVIYDGRLIFRDGYDYQLMGSEEDNGLSDGEWHTLFMTCKDGTIQAMVDDLPIESLANKSISSVTGHVLRLGQATRIYRLGASDLPDPFDGELFDGEIDRFRFYDSSFNKEEMVKFMKGQVQADKTLILDWGADNKGQNNRVKKGPIRIQSDLSKIRYANIWLEDLED